MFSNESEKIETMYKWIKDNIKHEKMSIGIHKNATRPHVHFGLTKIEKPNVKHLRLYYNRKGLKDIHPDIKLSPHENVTEEDCKKCLAYPLKEYEKFEDIKYREYISIDDQELEGYRVFAHGVYRVAKYIQNNKEEKKEAGNTRLLGVENFLNKKIETEIMELDPMYAKSEEIKKLKPEYENNIGKLYVYIFRIVCDYNNNEELKLTWRWTDIANYSYSKMYRLCDDDQYHEKVIMFQQKLKYNVK
jgi:hypothetical protein